MALGRVRCWAWCRPPVPILASRVLSRGRHLLLCFLCLFGWARATPGRFAGEMLPLEIQLCRSAHELFGALPETFACIPHRRSFLGRTQRRDGGTCNQVGLWVYQGGRWWLVMKSLSLDGGHPGRADRARLDRHGVTPPVLERLERATTFLLLQAPARWDLDPPYKVWPQTERK